MATLGNDQSTNEYMDRHCGSTRTAGTISSSSPDTALADIHDHIATPRTGSSLCNAGFVYIIACNNNRC